MLAAHDVTALLATAAYAHVYNRAPGARLPVVKIIAQTIPATHGYYVVQCPDGKRTTPADAATTASYVNDLLGLRAHRRKKDSGTSRGREKMRLAPTDLYAFTEEVAWTGAHESGGKKGYFGMTHLFNGKVTLCGRRPPRDAWFERHGDGACAQCEATKARLERARRGF